MENNNGIQIWTVPKTGTYTIRAAGAKGASVNNVAGSGMIVEIKTTLTMGEKIKILVGQAGLTPYSSGSGGGGGGGSFVVKYTNNTAILVAGGGGGSDVLDLVGPQKNGLVGNNGGNGGPTSEGGTISIPGTGGINGNGGTASSGGGNFGGAGGGGLNTDGGNSRYFYQTYATGGKAFVNGGAGGPYGGFGGGGGLRSDDFGNGGPGGGGYSGGGGGASYSGGGGGGSYSITESFTASGTLNHDDGYVIITFVPYEFESHTFTPAGAYGRYGPTLQAVRTAYNTSWAKDTNYLNMVNDNGIQIWTVPATGTYRIKAAGAKGGGYAPGKGMIVEIETSLNMYDKIKILVGQHGSGDPSFNVGAGNGGGGSFVVKLDNTAILVAGGGGGSGNQYQWGTHLQPLAQLDGLVGKNGGNGGGLTNNSVIGGGGSGGSSGLIHGGGGGGGGFRDNGQSGNPPINYPNDPAGGGGFSFLNGGIGGDTHTSEYYNTYTGFGGGGGYQRSGGGGGGGYSGGAAGNHNTIGDHGGGGGGGSYSITGSFTASGDLNNGDGYVTITKI
jgi:hypothetical protein